MNTKVLNRAFYGKGLGRSMAKGTVTWFSEQKGYGFISPNDGGESIFVHYTDIVGSGFRSLKVGEIVSYVPARGPRGRVVARTVHRTE